MVGKASDLAAIVRDVEDRHAQIITHALEVRQDSLAQFEINGCQRLVQEQQFRRRHQGTRERHSLTLAPGERGHLTIDEAV